MIQLKRVYEKPGKTGGLRILVDRLWPRGLSKGKARIDVWLKDVAPSDRLRKWYGHDPKKKWKAFRQQYMDELRGNKGVVVRFQDLLRTHRNVTFLYAAKDLIHNNAVVLRSFLRSS